MLSSPSFLLLFQAMLFTSKGSLISARAVRGYRASHPLINELPYRHLKEDKNKNNKNNKDKNEHKHARDAGRDGVATITTAKPPVAPNNASSPLVHPNQSENIPQIESEQEQVTSAPSETLKTPLPNDIEISGETFDTSKFLTATRFEPITFHMNVEKVNRATNTTTTLRSYFKDFIEGIIAMRSNIDWYPTHSKSVDKLIVDLVLPYDDADSSPETSESIPVKLIINGIVFVHVKDEETNNGATTRSAGTPQQDPVIVDRAFQSTFDHSMLLYFTFWGTDGLQKVLQEDGGLRKPVIDSVVLGEKEVIAFGTDKDDNIAYKPKRSATENTRSSSAGGILKNGLFLTPILLMSGVSSSLLVLL